MSFDKFGWFSYVSHSRVSKFVGYLQNEKIYGTKCKECGAVQFPPRAHCARCLSTSHEWASLSGNCTLISFTKVEAAPAAFKEQAPYTLGLAEMAEGPKVFAWIDKKIPEEQITIGMKLQLKASKLQNANVTYTLTRPSTT
jgi:uncharacterized OB-fold protein